MLNHFLLLNFLLGAQTLKVYMSIVGPCNPNPNITNDFECRGRENGRMCVPVKLKCDQYDNCGDLSDESTDYANCPFRKYSMNILMVLFMSNVHSITTGHVKCTCTFYKYR